MARFVAALLPLLLLSAQSIPIQAGSGDEALQPALRCFTVDAKPALVSAITAAGQQFYDGKSPSDAAFKGAVSALAADCAARLGWQGPVRDAATAYLWFMANEAILAQRLGAAGIRPEALIAFAQALPEADRRPFFDPRSQPDAAFRQRMIAALGKAGFITADPRRADMMVDYIYARGALNSMGGLFAATLAQPSGTSVQAAANGRAPLGDPRECLIARAGPDYEKLTLSVRKSLFPGEVSAATIHEEILEQAIAADCVLTRGWPLAYEESARSFLFSDTRARLLGQRLRQQGFDLTRLDAYIAAQPNKRQHVLKWLYPKDQDYPREFAMLTGMLNKAPQGDVQNEMMRKYINNRADADRMLSIFEDMKRIDTAAFISHSWQVLPALEASRPVIRERVLDKNERAEVGRLARAYSAPVTSGGKRLADLQRLFELAQSGDKAAMIAARDAVARGIPYDLSKHYSYFNVTEIPFRLFTDRLAAMWTAMIWHRHGYDDGSRKYMKACVGGLYGDILHHEKDGVGAILGAGGVVIPVNSQGITMDPSADGCGFTLLGTPAAQAKGAKVLQFYDMRGSFGGLGNRKESGDYAITGVRFSPILGDAAFLENKFAEHMRLRRSGLLFESRTGGYTFATPTLIVTLPWYEHYARETGRFGDMQRADASANQAIAAKLRSEGQAKVDRWNRALEAFKADRNSYDKQVALQYAASDLGGSYWQEYRRLVPDPYASSSTSGPARMVASGTGSSGYREVEVRSYDSNGTYTGSTRVSAAWADIMKMTSSAPR